MDSMREKWRSELDRVDELASASKVRRFLNNPVKYWRAVLRRKLFRTGTKRQIPVLCKTFFGTNMHLTLPSGTDIYLTGGKSHDSEIRLARFLIDQLREGNVFFDLGAHYGYFSLLASRLVGRRGRVVSFEAAPSTFSVLNKNSLLAGNMEIHHCAVSDSNASLTFYEFPNLYGEYNTLDVEQFKNSSWFSGSKARETEVQGVLLDEFIAEHSIRPDLIKIDVEGAEYKVLKGAENFLERNAPLIAMEFLSDERGNQPHHRAEQFLRSLGYHSFAISKSGDLEPAAKPADYLRKSGLESDNMVFVRQK